MSPQKISIVIDKVIVEGAVDQHPALLEAQLRSAVVHSISEHGVPPALLRNARVLYGSHSPAVASTGDTLGLAIVNAGLESQTGRRT